jgi:aminoglycoside phosphotransferase (APT) family kinase protein
MGRASQTMTEAGQPYRQAIAEVRPDLAGEPLVLHTRGWDSDAVEAGDTIFKFPKRPEAVDRLKLEARILALVRPRVPLAVPDLRLHETSRVFSEHRMIPGEVIETAHYDALSEQQKAGMAEALAGFYAALHAIPVAAATAIGVGPKPGWLRGEVALPKLAARLPTSMHDYARHAFAAYESLPPEDDIFGYFDGHGWNMAFDHSRGVLNGVYDFADAGIGPRSRDFTYTNLTSGDLTLRIIAIYNRITGSAIDPRTVAIRTAVQTLSELAGEDEDLDIFVAGAMRWHDFMQSRLDLRL